MEDKYTDVMSEISVKNSLINHLEEENNELKAENRELKDKIIDELQTEAIEQIKDNKKLQADKMKHILAYDTLQAEYNSLKADNKRLYQEHKQCREDAVKHYPKEYKAEADEYFEHNPHCDKLFFFMIEGNEFDEDGDYNGTLYVDDCIAEIDNMEVN